MRQKCLAKVLDYFLQDIIINMCPSHTCFCCRIVFNMLKNTDERRKWKNTKTEEGNKRCKALNNQLCTTMNTAQEKLVRSFLHLLLQPVKYCC